jgi:hyperosmotically inducible periplasmic protein
MRHPNLIIPTVILTTGVALGGIPLSAADSDARIERSARESYNFRTYLKEDSIQVKASDGVVTLTGNVAQEGHKDLAEATVASLPGVKRVDNQLNVAANQPGEHSDGWITMKVKMALAFHKNVKATSTEVRTDGGVVTLTGTADSQSQKDLTTEYVKDVDGVREVRNNLVVARGKGQPERFTGKVDDASITAQVKAALLFHKSTHAMATKVTTEDGVVTLRGEVENAAERDLAAKYAEDVTGVKKVRNEMTVRRG